MGDIDLYELDLDEFFDRLEEIEALADGHLFDMIDYTTGTTNYLSRLVRRLERRGQEGALFYAPTRSVGHAEARLARLGLALHDLAEDPEDSGYVYVFVEEFEWEEESDESEDEGGEYALGHAGRYAYDPYGADDDGLAAAMEALAVRERGDYLYDPPSPKYVVHEHHYHVEHTNSTAQYNETHYHGERVSKNQESLRTAAQIAGVAMGAAAAGCSIM